MPHAQGVDALAKDKADDPACTVCMTDKKLAKVRSLLVGVTLYYNTSNPKMGGGHVQNTDVVSTWS